MRTIMYTTCRMHVNALQTVFLWPAEHFGKTGWLCPSRLKQPRMVQMHVHLTLRNFLPVSFNSIHPQKHNNATLSAHTPGQQPGDSVGVLRIVP